MRREHPTLDERWARFIAANDVECLACGYNLRGLEGRICPECGGRIDPAALLFVGEESLTIRGVVERTGVPGAMVVAIAVQLAGLLVAPNTYLAAIGLTDARGVSSVDSALSASLAMIAVFAAVAWRMRADRFGTGLFRNNRCGLAWAAWGLVVAKVALLLLIGVVRMFG